MPAAGLVMAATGAMMAAAQLGAAYPGAKLDGAVDRQVCAVSYKLETPDPIERVAAFYKAQAAMASVRLLDDSGARFAGYRTLTFSSRPKFLFVLLARSGTTTRIAVRYHLDEPRGCH